MRLFILALLIFTLGGPAFSQSDKLSELLNEGIALHDKGDFAKAVNIYDKIIQLDSSYQGAYYEKSFSLYSWGKYAEAIELCTYFLDRFPDSKLAKDIFTNHGSALDAMGKSTEAISVYTEGILKYPDSYMLHFNRGITEYQLKLYPEAANDFKNSVSLSPFHPSSHQSLAYCVYEKNKVAGMLALSVFLMLEPEGKRAEKNLNLLYQLLGSNVKKGEKNIEIKISAEALDSTKVLPDNFHMLEMMISMKSALDYDEKFKDLSAAEKLKSKLELFGNSELTKVDYTGFFTEFYIPFFKQLNKDKQLLTACYIINATADDPQTQKWLDKNKQTVKEFYDWLKDYKWTEL